MVRLAPQDSLLTLVPEPARVMTVGMTQREAKAFLESRGLTQVRKGEADDNAIVVEQEPELTMEALNAKEIETLGVEKERISEWIIHDKDSPKTAHYLRKMTGLDHKAIGTLKVYFTYPDMPMINFEGNATEASGLLPEKTFEKESTRGQVAITNMSRPNRGLIGIRLEDSPEFGPTGEEPYGTNLVGEVTSDLSLLMKDLKDGDIVYIREVAPPPLKKRKKEK